LNMKGTFSSTSFKRFRWVMSRDAFQANRKVSGVDSRQAWTVASVGRR